MRLYMRDEMRGTRRKRDENVLGYYGCQSPASSSTSSITGGPVYISRLYILAIVARVSLASVNIYIYTSYSFSVYNIAYIPKLETKNICGHYLS